MLRQSVSKDDGFSFFFVLMSATGGDVAFLLNTAGPVLVLLNLYFTLYCHFCKNKISIFLSASIFRTISSLC